jgi:hypothetical protein
MKTRKVPRLSVMTAMLLSAVLLLSAFQYVRGRATTVYVNAGAPTNGVTLAKVASPGSLLSDSTNGVLYQQTGTLASPIWTNPIGIAAGAVSSIKLADDIAHTVQVPLAAANIIAMRTTPVSLIAAPGSGKILIVESIVFKMVRTGTAFTGGGALEFRYTDGSGVKVSADIAATVVTTGGAGTEYNQVGGAAASSTPVANAAIVITNATAAFAAGTGTAQASIKYRIVTP